MPFSLTNMIPKNAPVSPISRISPACTLRKIQTNGLITREFFGLRMQKFQGVIFKSIRTYMEFFKSALVLICISNFNLHDQAKATSISTSSFPLLQVIKINLQEFSHFLVGVFRVFACIRVPWCTKMTSACNTENYHLVILFGRAKHLKLSVILFKRFRAFFDQRIKPIYFFPRMKKRWLDFTIDVFYIQLLKQMQNPSKIGSLYCDSQADLFKILKIIR